MKISYRIAQKDLRDFIFYISEWLCRHTALKKKVFILLVILPIFSYIERENPSNFVRICLILTFIGFSIDTLLSFFRAHKLGRYLLTEPHGITCGEHEFEYRDGMIIERTPQHEIRRTWNRVSSIEEGENHVGLIMETPPCVWLPKDAFASPEELTAFLQHARTSVASAAEEITDMPHSPHSMQHVYQGLRYIWNKQFWVIPVLLFLLGIGIYHYQNTTQNHSEDSSTSAVIQPVERKSYFRILPDNASCNSIKLREEP